MQHATPLTAASLFVVITGAVNSGKTQQVVSILDAVVDDQEIATPTLFVLAEASAEGTAGAVLGDPSRACVWPVTDCEEATAAVRACFPDAGPLTLGEAKAAAYRHAVRAATEAHARAVREALEAKPALPPPPPAAPPQPQPSSPLDHVRLRSLVVDTGTTLYGGSRQTAARLYKDEARRKNRGVEVRSINKKEDPSQNDMNTHAYAAKACQDMIDRLNGVTQHHRGVIVVVTVHTCPAIAVVSGGPDEPAQKLAVGETPFLGAPKDTRQGLQVPAFSKTWDLLAAKANLVVHCFADAPDYTAVSLDNVNDVDNVPGVTYGLITAKGVYAKRGPVLWVKQQDGGTGPWAYLSVMPRYWHPDVRWDETVRSQVSASPSVGAVLAYSLRQYRAAVREAAKS